MRAHISINVSNLKNSVLFYEKVFGVKPQKMTDDYAKFDLKNPSLNFAMHSKGDVSKINHFGIEVESAEEVKNWEKALTDRGLLTQPEDNTDCCFARQDKVWIQDPDKNSWEIFFVHEQLPVEKKVMSCSPSANVFGTKCC